MSSVINPTTPVQPDEIIQQLRAIRDQIPDFVQLPSADRLSLRSAANVDPKLVQMSINAVGASSALASALGRPAEELRQDVETAARWGAVVEEAQALLAGVSSAVAVRRHRLGLTALQVYSISRQLVRQKEHANLLPHVKAMQTLKRLGRVKGPLQPGSNPGPQTEPIAQAKTSASS